ncbi:MAG: S-layer homology domain-containing protein [Tissierellia bacterium]|nr:S-layer homology domain-containing protein [Tissierellia bacterium]
MKKKILSLTLAIVMTLGMAVSALADFSDTSEHWAKSNIDWAISQGLVRGDGDGKFRPNDPISKVEFYAIINRFIGAEKEANVPFNDIKATDWYYKDVAKAIGAGYISGTPKEALIPKDYIKRGNAFRILAHVYNINHDVEYANSFKDANQTTRLENGAIGGLAKAGIISGYEDNTIRPMATISRAELCKILNIANDKLGKANVNRKPVNVPKKDIVTKPDGTTSSLAYYKGKYYTMEELQRVLHRDYSEYYSGNIPLKYGDRTVKFVVTDKYGKEISSPTIRISSFYSSYANLNSNTVNLTDGNYYFEISKPGFERFTGTFDIRGKDREIKVVLLPTGSRYDDYNCEYYGGCEYGPDHVKVIYVDNYGNEIASPDYRRGYHGSTITVYSKFIPGYRLVSKDGVKQYIYRNSDNTVKFEYVRDPNYTIPDSWNGYPPYWYNPDEYWGDNKINYEVKMSGTTSKDLERQLNQLFPHITFVDISSNTPTVYSPIKYIHGYYSGYSCDHGYCGWNQSIPVIVRVIK